MQYLDEGEIFDAVAHDNVDLFKNLLHYSRNQQDKYRDTLLHLAIEENSVQVFDYLLTLTDFEFDEDTAFLLSATVFNTHFAKRLLERGANICAIDNIKNTFLHSAINNLNSAMLDIGRLVIEEGLSVNQQNMHQETPLHVACSSGREDWIHMLLYYGADVSILSNISYLPFDLYQSVENCKEDLLEILFNYTFHEEKMQYNLSSIVTSMGLNTSWLFHTLVARISVVNYCDDDLWELCMELPNFDPRCFKIFIQKYSHIFEEMLHRVPISVCFNQLEHCWLSVNYVHNLNVILDSDFAADFAQCLKSLSSTNTVFLKIFDQNDLPLNLLEELIYNLASYGMIITSNDLDAVFKRYGYCDFFKTLLHMDIKILNNRRFYLTGSIMPLLTYDIHSTIESSLMAQPIRFSPECLRFFNLKNFYHKWWWKYGGHLEELMARTCIVPSLLELSRNAARQHLINVFKIKNSMQFFTILHWLPVSNSYKRILSYETKLYTPRTAFQ